MRSLDIGCVRLTEKHLAQRPAGARGAVERHRARPRGCFEEVLREVPAFTRRRSTLVGVAGTISTVAAVEMGLAEWDRDVIHHFDLTRAAAEDVFRTLATETAGRPAPQPGARGGPGRRDRRRLLRARAAAAHARRRRLLVSESDILDGLVLQPRRPARRVSVTAPDRAPDGPRARATRTRRRSPALGRPMLGHLDPEFIEVLDEMCARLRTVFGTANALTLPISGTGSAGMEAAFVNVVGPGDVVRRRRSTACSGSAWSRWRPAAAPRSWRSSTSGARRSTPSACSPPTRARR